MTLKNKQIAWLNSEGGPLVMLSAAQAGIWKGALNSNHYDLACDVEDYLSVLNVENQLIIVLGDEPLPTCSLSSGEHLFIIRCYWIDDEENFCNYFEKIKEQYTNLELLEKKLIETNDTKWVVFDSAYTIFDSKEKINVILPDSQCEISTYKYEEEKASFLIHVFASKE